MALREPAHRTRVVGSFSPATAVLADEAVVAARTALPAWRALTSIDRARIVRKAASIIEDRSESTATLMTREQGKTLAVSRGELPAVTMHTAFSSV